MFENLALGFASFADPMVWAAVFFGAFVGYLIGAIPGLGPSLGIALLIPFTYGMDPVVSIVGLVALYAGFAGLAIALVVYNLSLWVAMRHRFQLWYCAMVASLMAYTFTSGGIALQVFPDLANTDRLRLNYVLLALAGASALRFFRHFFEPRVFPPWLTRLAAVTSLAAIGSGLAFAIFAPAAIALLDRAYFILMSVMLATMVPVIWSAWQQRSRFLGLFLLAWSAPMVISVIRAAYGFHLVPYSFWIDNGNIITLAIEALLSSMMITARLRDMSNERDQALAGEQVARRLAATDPLTGLLNRRAFLDMAIGRTARQRLLLIDVDHFKAVNDRLGHAGGDDVLRAVADTLQACRPPGALAVRLGGEEFALLVPRGSFALCPPDMVLQAVREAVMPQGLKVTVSIGMGDGSTATEEDWKRLYRLADAALYRAKSDGRDRACRATDFRAVA
ncbi:MAG TPA: diguanylate cyclase [Novosphingobium sp.]|nr:diguanylate cyclase [Novosphingobium sp.]